MSRIACLFVPDMCLKAHLRLVPELKGLPLALTEGRAPHSLVVAASQSAVRSGIVPGLKASQARAICDAVTVRPVSSEALAAALATLADVAGTASGRVEFQAPDRVFLDCGGGRLLWASESELASVLSVRAARCGLPIWVGIADSKLGASVAAREGNGIRIVPPGTTRAFLAPLPLRFLEPDVESSAKLVGWGIHFIGDLAALPSGAVVHRLGRSGVALVRSAQGEDDAPLASRRDPGTFAEGLDLDYGVDSLEPLLFIIRRLIECLTDRIGLHGLGCRSLELGFALEGGGRELRTITAAAPTTEHKIFMTLLRAHLEQSALPHAVIGVSVVGAASRIRSTQLDLLRPAGPAPADTASMLARLAVLCGPDRVGVLRRADSHRPDAVEVVSFDGELGPVREEPVAATGAPVIRLALRALRPPVPVEVFERAGSIQYVRGSDFAGYVMRRAGPWRLRGEWWTSEPYAREYYDVELDDGGMYRIYRDVRSQRWLADGVYD